MKIKIDDIFLNNSFPNSINLERRIVVNIPYTHTEYLLISEMNLTFKENNPRLFGVQTQSNDIESEDTVFEKNYDSTGELFENFQEDIINYLLHVKEEKWVNFCQAMYSKYKKEFNLEQQQKQTTRFLNFNKSTLEVFKTLNSESFLLGNDQDMNEWNIFWKYSQMQNLSKRLNYKQTEKVKIRKI